jgi:polyisoprenoid-binding protein YceI
VINGRTFATGNGFRDRAIRGPIILNSSDDQFEFITFDPTEISGLSGTAEVGDEISFTVTGDLTVKGTTNQEVFDVTVSFVDAGTISGEARTTVMREDYGIGIPNAPGVADVSEEAVITLTFVATAG